MHVFYTYLTCFYDLKESKLLNLLIFQKIKFLKYLQDLENNILTNNLFGNDQLVKNLNLVEKLKIILINTDEISNENETDDYILKIKLLIC